MDAQPTLLAFFLDPDGGVRMHTAEGREFVCRSAAELWADLRKAMSAGKALTGKVSGPRHHRVVAEPISSSNGDPAFDRAKLEQGIADASEVFEEACAQEWGSIGRAGAQLIRKHAPRVARAVSPRNTKKRRARMTRGRG